MDLKFPHHECEIAQNTATTGKESVRYWMHGNMLTLNGQRMSKSTGNTLLPGELFSGNTDKLEKGFAPTVARFFMMQAHYGSQLDFSSEALLAAEKGYLRLMDAIKNMAKLEVGGESQFDVQAWRKDCYAAMNDDFNTPILISHLFEAVKFINGSQGKPSGLNETDLELLKNSMSAFVFDVLGLEDLGEQKGNDKLDDVMNMLIQMRAKARADKDWALSDALRDQLAAIGIQLKDGKDGTGYSIN